MNKVVFNFIVILLTIGSFCVAFAAQEPFPKHRLRLSTGITMTYVEFGKSTGDSVIFLHGLTDTKRSFYPMMKHLSRLRPDLRLIALDQRGHGESSMPSPQRNCAAAPEQCFRFSDFASDLLSFMDRQKILRAYLVGHSMGSIVAQEVALTKPERIIRLVLIATAAKGKANPVFRDFLLAGLIEGPWKKSLERKGYDFPGEAYTLTPLDADREVEKWMLENWVVDPVADPDFVSSILPETCRIPIGTWLGGTRNLRDFDNTERLKGLKVPTLVLWPTQDSIFLQSDQTVVRESLDIAAERYGVGYFWKQYGTRALPPSGAQENDIGHNLHWSAPKAVAIDLASYLSPKGVPTSDLFYAAPTNPRQVLTSPGKAIIVERPRTK